MIDPKSLTFTQKDGQFLDTVDFVIAQQGADGRNLKVDAEVLHLAFTLVGALLPLPDPDPPPMPPMPKVGRAGWLPVPFSLRTIIKAARPAIWSKARLISLPLLNGPPRRWSSDRT